MPSKRPARQPGPKRSAVFLFIILVESYLCLREAEVVHGSLSVVSGHRQAKSQIPISKLQGNPDAQIPNPKPAAWSLDLGASLGFGVWDLYSLFITQRLHWIDLRRASGGNKARQPSHTDQQQRETGVCYCIGGFHF